MRKKKLLSVVEERYLMVIARDTKKQIYYSITQSFLYYFRDGVTTF